MKLRILISGTTLDFKKPSISRRGRPSFFGLSPRVTQLLDRIGGRPLARIEKCKDGAADEAGQSKQWPRRACVEQLQRHQRPNNPSKITLSLLIGKNWSGRRYLPCERRHLRG